MTTLVDPVIWFKQRDCVEANIDEEIKYMVAEEYEIKEKISRRFMNVTADEIYSMINYENRVHFHEILNEYTPMYLLMEFDFSGSTANNLCITWNKKLESYLSELMKDILKECEIYFDRDMKWLYLSSCYSKFGHKKFSYHVISQEVWFSNPKHCLNNLILILNKVIKRFEWNKESSGISAMLFKILKNQFLDLGIYGNHTIRMIYCKKMKDTKEKINRPLIPKVGKNLKLSRIVDLEYIKRSMARCFGKLGGYHDLKVAPKDIYSIISMNNYTPSTSKVRYTLHEKGTRTDKGVKEITKILKNGILGWTHIVTTYSYIKKQYVYFYIEGNFCYVKQRDPDRANPRHNNTNKMMLHFYFGGYLLFHCNFHSICKQKDKVTIKLTNNTKQDLIKWCNEYIN